jgi:azurin
MIRLQGDRLKSVNELLSLALSDAHPRVQMDVINAITHLRPAHPEVENILKNFSSNNKNVKKSLSYLDYGIEPHKGRSVPVLEVAANSKLKHWLYFGEEGKDKAKELVQGKGKFPAAGAFKTFFNSDGKKSAIVAINHKNLEIRLNNSLVFKQDSFWSGDQQINVDLKKGLNTLDVVLLNKGRRGRPMPPVFLYDSVGEAVQGVDYIHEVKDLRESYQAYSNQLTEQGEVIYLQTAAELQFAPKKLRVKANTKVKIVIENPDVMIHNWVLLKPDSIMEVGTLADQLAGSADGPNKQYLPDSDKILVASRLLNPKDKQEIIFQTPKKPGEYPYICTFPGHWRIMKGVLVVEK